MDGGFPPFVIDNGSMSIKAGFAGDETPRVVFPTTVGKPMYWDPANMTTYVGDSALSKRGTLRLTYPIKRGIISNWDDMEVIWRHTFFKKLFVLPGKHPVLLADRPLSPFSQREKMVQIMFETFNVPAMYLANHAVLSVIANGSMTGVAVDCGDGMVYSVPVFEGRALSYATLWLDFGGSDLTNYLTKMLYSRGYNLSGLEEELVLVRDMKEKLGYVALDYERELESAQRRISSDVDENYKLPDGQVIKIGVERFKCPEVLFQPYLMDKDADGIHEITNESIKKCNIDIRKMLYGNILLCGRSTLFPGFVDRMSKEITSLLAPNSSNVKVLAHPRRRHTAWEGGSVLATMASFQQKWISKSEYDESGPAIVHRQLCPLPF